MYVTDGLGKTFPVATQRHANDGATFQKWQIGESLRNGTAGETDDEQASILIYAAKRLVENVAAHRVIDHVHTGAIGQCLNL